MRVIIKSKYEEVCNWTACYIVERINTHKAHTPQTPFVLGLPTGGTIVGVYKQLVAMYKEKKISFKNVITFNMDEYVGLAEDHPQSYHYFMQEHLYKHIDIPKENINLPDGMAKNLDQAANDYEDKIKKVGGIDLFVGGIGADGHIAFNEPGSSLASVTRVKTLNNDTLLDNARYFNNNINLVPKTAITIGIQTIMDSQSVLILASGINKAVAIQKMIEEGVNHMCTASCLQLHKQAIIVCDEDATENLRVKTYKYLKNLEIAQ